MKHKQASISPKSWVLIVFILTVFSFSRPGASLELTPNVTCITNQTCVDCTTNTGQLQWDNGLGASKVFFNSESGSKYLHPFIVTLVSFVDSMVTSRACVSGSESNLSTNLSCINNINSPDAPGASLTFNLVPTTLEESPELALRINEANLCQLQVSYPDTTNKELLTTSHFNGPALYWKAQVSSSGETLLQTQEELTQVNSSTVFTNADQLRNQYPLWLHYQQWNRCQQNNDPVYQKSRLLSKREHAFFGWDCQPYRKDDEDTQWLLDIKNLHPRLYFVKLEWTGPVSGQETAFTRGTSFSHFIKSNLPHGSYNLKLT